MKQQRNDTLNVIFSISCILLISIMIAGCTTTPVQPPESQTMVTMQMTPAQSTIAIPIPSSTSTVPATTTKAPVTTTAPAFTPSEGDLVVFTAASLTGASKEIGPAFERAYPGHSVTFSLDGTQALKTKVENGAYSDVFISASNSYTNSLKSEGYFVNDSIKILTTNYVIVILPASNPGNIHTLADLTKPGTKIAMAANNVPVGTATYAALANLAKSTYGQDWNRSVFSNVVTYETAEPGVATKVSLGEVDAGFVYESTYSSAPADTLTAITIPRRDNYLQTYTIGILKQTENSGTAKMFEDFMLSAAGQQILKDYGFRPVSAS